jgi:outer membrane protein insertion porin family
MASVRRQVSRLLRTVAGVLLLSSTLEIARLHAQVGSAPGPPNVSAQPGLDPRSPPAAAQPFAAPQERVLDIRLVGNARITREKVLSNIGTRIDRPFDQATFEKDVRKLSSKNWFVQVQPKTEHVSGGIVITLEVVERPVLQYVQYYGWKKVKPKTLAKETGLAKGDALDPYAIQDGARKIESFYQGKGYNDVKVSVVEGTKPGDRGAVYLINEGKVQKFSKINFEGNSSSIAPDGRLRTVVQSKKPFLGLFKGQVDRKKIEDDKEKLTNYYRSLGFFKAHVGCDPDLNENEDRMELTFYIVEGPRYRVNSISFIGNKVYPEEAFSQNLKLKSGDFFDQNKMNADVGSVKDLYGSNGYVFAEAKPDLRFFDDPDKLDELDVIYQVTEGNRYKLGDIDIQIKGENPHTKYSTVFNRLSMRPGDWADIRQFRSSERRLKASGLFNVDPSKGETPKIVFSPPDSEDGLASGKKKSTAKRSGDPDSFRGQSPDGVPAPASVPAGIGPEDQRPPFNPVPTGRPAAAAPVSQVAPPQAPTIRFQSPDGYGGYGGTAVNPISPSPQPYTVNQPPPTYTGQAPYAAPPPAGGYSYAPGYGQGAPPPNGQYTQPGYSSGGAQQPPAVQGPPGYDPPGQIIQSPGPLVEPPTDAPTIPFTVVVNEAQTGRFMLGAGVNSNAGLVGSIVLDEQNFDWRRVPSSWEDFRSGTAFRGAGQKFRIEAAPGTIVQRYLFNFTEPYLFDTPVSLGLSGFYYNRFFRDWVEQRVGGRTSLGYQFTPDLSGNIALRAEDIRISQPRVPGVPDLDAVLGHTQLYSAKGTLAHDTRDSTFLATEGHYLEMDFEYVVGTFQYPRFMTNARKHILLRERPDGSGRHTLSFYNQFGISGKDTPIYERFFAGGFSTLRGFQFRGASPQVSTVLVGGDLMNVSSVEYMFPITADDMLRGVTFVDFGTVEKTANINWNNIRVAPGMGLRVTIPMISPAPIALDFAFPIHNAPGDLKQVFSFFVGVGH